VAGSKQNASGGLADANDMAGGGSGKNSILADDELLDTVGGTDLGNQLDDLGVPEPAITTNDKGRA
jgi:hypothetical protein